LNSADIIRKDNDLRLWGRYIMKIGAHMHASIPNTFLGFFTSNSTTNHTSKPISRAAEVQFRMRIMNSQVLSSISGLILYIISDGMRVEYPSVQSGVSPQNPYYIDG
jgi:hypothetical protein